MVSKTIHIEDAEGAELLNREKIEAERAFRLHQHPRAYASPRALNQFLSGELSELPNKSKCRNHELLLIGNQTFEDERVIFLSTVCGNCHHHFHVRSDSKPTLHSDVDHPCHMLILSKTKSRDDLRSEHTKYSRPEGYIRFICADSSCPYWLEITSFSPRLSRNEVDMLQSSGRVRLNLKEARIEDSERYKDVGDDYGANTPELLSKYLQDALDDPPSGGPRKIRKRNKRFKVSFSNDFDPLLRSLGFQEFRDIKDVDGAESIDDSYWLICQPEPADGPTTPVGTLRAKVEDAAAEVALLHNGNTTSPAWDHLLRAFGGRYLSVTPDKSISEEDLALLGCLRDFPPRYFSWAGRTLSTVRPSSRNSYLEAALRCVRNRDENAQSDIVLYQSQFDTVNAVDKSLEDAYKFFDASGTNQNSPDYLLSKYYVIAQADRTDATRALAQQHLEVIGHHLGIDIVSRIDPRALEDISTSVPLATTDGKKRRMSIRSATQVLKVDAVFTSEMIRDFVLNLDDGVDRDQVAEALEVLADLKKQQDKEDEAKILYEYATSFRETGMLPFPTESTAPNGGHVSEDPKEYMHAPPGLRNIGNTCYLNSLLQYFYNVKVIRDLLNNFEEFKLGLDEQAISQRRTGGSGNSVNLEEAIVARQFAEMLGELFQQLSSTTEAAAQPSQKLANTALSSAKDILSERKPPPLPARPSPAPPLPPKEDVDMVHVTVESVNEQAETASSRSSQTLVEEVDDDTLTQSNVILNDDGKHPDTAGQEQTTQTPPVSQPNEDVVMKDDQGPVTLDEKIALVSQRLEQSDRSGTSQQDVEEIIGNILEHLMRAIRPDGPMAGKPDLQADKITETFFTMIVNSTAKTVNNEPDQTNALHVGGGDILNEELIPERWITAFPHPDKENKVKVPLYAALDRYFNYELIADGTLARYSTIRTLPPILHICIQRSDASGVKNRNPVAIPDALYMDRYMEAEADSPLWGIRRRVWAIKERLGDLDTRKTDDAQVVIRETTDDWQTSSFFNDAWGNDSKPDEDVYEVQLDGALIGDIAFPTSKRKSPASSPAPSPPPKRRLSSQSSNANATSTELLGNALSDLDQELKLISEMSVQELVDLRQKEEADFDSLQKEKYSLHAVICHGGGMAAGHYWVWIHDFRKNVWYKYNDGVVTEDARTSQAVLDELNDSGDPYYVAYVRDELKHELVEVPQRSITAIPATATGTVPTAGDDVEMQMEMQTIDGVDPDAPPGGGGGGGAGPSRAEKGKGIDRQGIAEEKVPPYADEPRPYELL